MYALAFILNTANELVKLYFQYQSNHIRFKRFFNNKEIDVLLVIMIGLLSVCFIILGILKLLILTRPFIVSEYGMAIAILMFSSGLFFIKSCELMEATIIPKK